MNNLIKYYKIVLNKYAVFEGRAGRAEYWYFVLANMIASIIVGIIGSILHDRSNAISNLYSLVLFIPSLSVGSRRLHDIGKSGWWQLLCLLPVIGWIWLIIYFVEDSQIGKNEYGPHPKEVKAEKI
jgi:uncharacterized membrane protein YhaH (DUF805 family)